MTAFTIQSRIEYFDMLSEGLQMMGRNISNSRMERTIPTTPSNWTTKAVIHCLNFPPSSKGMAAIASGEAI